LSVFLCISLSSAQLLLVDNQWAKGNMIGLEAPRQFRAFWENLYNESLTVNVTYYPCYGYIDLYIGVDFPPTPSNNTHYFAWTESIFLSFEIPLDPGESINLLFVGTSTFPNSGTPISAAFDIIVNAGYLGYITDNGVPLVPNNGDVSGSLAKGGASGQISWPLTGNKADNYTMYYLNRTSFNTATTGFYSLNGCSTQMSMQPLTSGLSVSYSGNNGNADFTNLNPKQTLPVTVVVFRAGGYSSTYEVIYLNGAPIRGALLPLVLSVVLFFILG